MAKDKRPRGLGRSSGVTAPTSGSDTNSTARFNPISHNKGNKPTSDKGKNKSKEQDKDRDMTDAQPQEEAQDESQETANIALKEGEAGDELAELRQTYEAAQKQFAESGTQEYLRGTIHECDRMIRNCGEEVYPSSEFNFIYASALHDFSLTGAESEEVNGFVELALEYVSNAADLLDKEKDQEWIWKYYLVAGKVYLQKVKKARWLTLSAHASVLHLSDL